MLQGLYVVQGLAVTDNGNKYVEVCIEHFTNRVKVVLLPSKSSKGAAWECWREF